MDKNVQDRIQEILESSFLTEYLNDENITDISFNGTEMRIQHNIMGKYPSNYRPTKDEVMKLGKKIADEMGKQFNNNNPILDTELGYLRVNFVHESVSPSGCTFAIRVSRPKLAIKDLAQLANKEVAKLLDVLIKADKNIVISGETGSGKTELQKLLVSSIPDNKKVLLIEDTMDSHIKEIYPNKDVISWRTLTEETLEKKITYNDLIKAGLRNNPDWMIIAETRGSEAYSMLESALTDHSIITTIHAKMASAIPSRLINMIGQKYQKNELLLGKDIVNSLRFGIYMSMDETEEGIKRNIGEIVEFTDFTEKGVEYITLYSREKDYDENNNAYIEKEIMNPLSDETLKEIKNRELYHMLPNVFTRK